MRPPFQLQPDALSDDTIEFVAQLTELAQSGQAIGISATVMLKGRTFWVNSCGECKRNPVWTLGAVSLLSAELIEMSRGSTA